MKTREFNATAEGQKAMARDAGSRVNAFILAKWLKERGLPAYDDAFISTCNDSTLSFIKDEMIQQYNDACAVKTT